MTLRKYLVNAEAFAESKGDTDKFLKLYCQFRAHNDIKESTWKTLQSLYGVDIAYKIEQESAPSFL